MLARTFGKRDVDLETQATRVLGKEQGKFCGGCLPSPRSPKEVVGARLHPRWHPTPLQVELTHFSPQTSLV